MMARQTRGLPPVLRSVGDAPTLAVGGGIRARLMISWGVNAPPRHAYPRKPCARATCRGRSVLTAPASARGVGRAPRGPCPATPKLGHHFALLGLLRSYSMLYQVGLLDVVRLTLALALEGHTLGYLLPVTPNPLPSPCGIAPALRPPDD
jgi:hypothetical protein